MTNKGADNVTNNCGVCNNPVSIDHEQVGRWEADGSLTPYHMGCEGRAAKLKPCKYCGKHHNVCTDKLAIINSLPVIESSGSCGELEYVLVENTPETILTLKLLGATDSEIAEMTSDDGESIDISLFAFDRAGADWFSAKLGFIDYIPDDAPDWCREVYHGPT